MPLDNRAWLVWGLATTIPAIASRNPWILTELLVIVVTTNRIARGTGNVRWMVRLAVLFAAVTVVFNVLTVHSGDTVLAEVPGSFPIIGGDLTLNALLYGAISAAAILSVVYAWITVSSQLDWSALMRQLPDRIAPVAAAGSIAWAWLPAMRVAFRDIRESQRSRGLTRPGARTLPALIVPLLAGGLERAMTTTDVLDARGFGGGQAERSSSSGAVLIVLAVTGCTAAAYLAIVGRPLFAGAVVVASVATGISGLRAMPTPPPRSRWRPSPWSHADSLVTGASVLATLILLLRTAIVPEALAYATYPTLAVPHADTLAMTSLLLLFAPAYTVTRR